MPFRLAASISVIAALAAVPAGAQAANVVRTTSIDASSVVPAGGATTEELECPSPWVALNGAVTRMGTGVTLLRSRPGSDAGDWSFRFAAEGSARRRVSVVLRCVRLELPAGVSGTRLQVMTRRRPGVSIPAGATAAVRLRCGKAWVATGHGVSERRGTVRLASVIPSARGWDFVLENTGSTAALADVSARCLRRTVSATRGGGPTELRFRVTRPFRSNNLGTDRTPTFSHRCGANQFSLATGSVVDPLETIELALGAPLRVGWGRWNFRQASGGDTVRTYLVCLARGSGFS
jgi:hypothetical protein